jgi:Bax protein
MNRKRKLALLWGLIALVILSFFMGVKFPQQLPVNAHISQVESLDQQQQDFVALMVPKIDIANQQIMALRQQILLLRARVAAHKRISDIDKNFLKATAVTYGVAPFNVNDVADIDQLLAHVDIVPTSLVLAQAASESGWGSSHFARAADNFFGQHCYETSCGIMPEGVKNSDFEVQKFDTVTAAINGYLYNLNTNSSYQKFRDARARLRAEGRALTGPLLVSYLINYSALGHNYISMVNSIILVHGFSHYDQTY